MSLIVNPINSNPSHDAEHTVYLGGTGSRENQCREIHGASTQKRTSPVL